MARRTPPYVNATRAAARHATRVAMHFIVALRERRFRMRHYFRRMSPAFSCASAAQEDFFKRADG